MSKLEEVLIELYHACQCVSEYRDVLSTLCDISHIDSRPIAQGQYSTGARASECLRLMPIAVQRREDMYREECWREENRLDD